MPVSILILEMICFIFDCNVWRQFRVLKNPVSNFEVLPKGVPAIVGALLHGCIGHFEWEDMDSEKSLPTFKSGISKGVDLFNFVVSHRHAPCRDV